MPHPLLHLIAGRPNLLLEHLEAYADLIGAEAGHVSASWKRGALLNAVALCFVIVAVMLIGVALMLWAVVPATQMPQPWALVLVPLPPIAIALGCLMAGRTSAAGSAFENLRRQVKADMALLREDETT